MKRNHFLVKLSKRLEDILIDEQSKGMANLSVDVSSIAKYLMLNFFIMSMMNQFDYESFEEILKKLFKITTYGGSK